MAIDEKALDLSLETIRQFSVEEARKGWDLCRTQLDDAKCNLQNLRVKLLRNPPNYKGHSHDRLALRGESDRVSYLTLLLSAYEERLKGKVAKDRRRPARVPPDRRDLVEAIQEFLPAESSTPKPKRSVDLPPVHSAIIGTAHVRKIGVYQAPSRRVSDASADFDATVGKWMHEAHSRLRKQALTESRANKTPNLPPQQFRKIVERTDRAERNGKPRFPLKDVLSERVWKDIADHNTRAGVAGKKLFLWSDVAFHRQFKRAVRYRYNRAEIYYRKHVVPQQS